MTSELLAPTDCPTNAKYNQELFIYLMQQDRDMKPFLTCDEKGCILNMVALSKPENIYTVLTSKTMDAYIVYLAQCEDLSYVNYDALRDVLKLYNSTNLDTFLKDPNVKKLLQNIGLSE